MFFVSLAVYPAITVAVQPMDDKFFGTVEKTNDYYAPVTTFLTFNLFAMLGNLLVNDKIPKMGPKYIWIPITARILFIPFFMLCNYQPGARAWPVWFESDWLFWEGVLLLGLTSGYFSSLAMIYAPKTVEAEHAPIAGMMAGFFLITGILAGLCITFMWGWLVQFYSG